MSANGKSSLPYNGFENGAPLHDWAISSTLSDHDKNTRAYSNDIARAQVYATLALRDKVDELVSVLRHMTRGES